MDIIDVVPLCHGRCESKSHQTVCHKRSSFAQYEPQGPNTRLSADPRDNLSMIPMVTSHTRRVTFLILLSFISFYIGYINSSKTAKASAVSVPTPSDANDSNEGEAPDFISQIEKCYSYSYFSEACVHDNNEIHRRVQDVLYPKEQGDAHKLEKSLIHRSNRTVHGKLSSEFLSGSASISKREVMSKFDNFGVATFHKSHSSDEEVLLLYNTLDSLPSNTNSRFITQQQSRIPSVNTSEALENCQFLNVQFIHNPSSNSLPMCTVYIPGLNNLPTYHAQRWMRLNGRLQHVGSLTFPSGVNKFDLPKFHPVISKHWEALRTFLENADGVLEEVDSILKKRFEVLNEDDNTVIVMTVNRGDVDLLINFLCAAKSRDLDVRRILVFVADEESKKVIGSLSKSNYDDFGVMVYHDKYNLANVAKGGENQKYGDSAFTSMMFAKILCVLYPSLLGYNVLYQDADIVWYDNPLGFFRGDHPESSDMLNKYDIIFQVSQTLISLCFIYRLSLQHLNYPYATFCFDLSTMVQHSHDFRPTLRIQASIL